MEPIKPIQKHIPVKSSTGQAADQKTQGEADKPNDLRPSPFLLPRNDDPPPNVQQPQKLGLAFASSQSTEIPLTASIRDLPAAPSLKSTVLGTLFTGLTAVEPTLDQLPGEPKSVIDDPKKRPGKMDVAASKAPPLSSLFTGKKDAI